MGSLLGLLAILMATLAPTISHMLAANLTSDALLQAHYDMPSMQHGMTGDAMAGMDNMAGMAGMAGMDNAAPGPTDKQTDKSSPSHASMPDGDDCGYCSLLAHMPVMPTVQALFFVTIRSIQHRAATRFESVRRVEPLTFAQPRAPPAVS
jgi:hypothetical protein